MVHLTELLADPTSGVGVAWVTATMGLKSVAHKLNRHEINKLSISGLCLVLLRDQIPLRLSSTLLYGILLLYDYQSNRLLGLCHVAKFLTIEIV